MRLSWTMRVILLSLVLLAACGDGAVMTPLDAGRRAGILQLRGYAGTVAAYDQLRGSDRPVNWTAPPQAGDVVPPQVLIAPDTVSSGQVFEVRSVTIGPSGCWRADGQSVNVNIGGRVIELMPYDAHSGAEICTTILGFLEHASSLSLTQQGEWMIRVVGRRARHGDSVWNEPVTAERTIYVK